MKILVLVTVLGVCLCTEYNMEQEDEEVQKSSPEFLEKTFKEMDKNEDGFLDKREMVPWMADGFERLAVMDSSIEFDRLDTSKDDFVTLEEMIRDHLHSSLERIRGLIKDGRAKYADEMIFKYEEWKFTVCDKNKDDKLSRNEHYYFLNSAAILPNFDVENMWLEYDKNRDGKVPFEEFHDPKYNTEEQTPEHQKESDKAFFESRDLNKDGILDYNEVRAMIQPDREEQAEQNYDYLMTVLDKDGDKKLSKEEYMNGGEEMHLFDISHVEVPALRDDDIEGPPVEPKSRIDFDLYEGHVKDAKVKDGKAKDDKAKDEL